MRGVWPRFSYSPSGSIKEHLFYEFHNVIQICFQLFPLSHYGCHSFLSGMSNKISPLFNINDDKYITTKSKRIGLKSDGFLFECESNNDIPFKSIYEDGQKEKKGQCEN